MKKVFSILMVLTAVVGFSLVATPKAHAAVCSGGAYVVTWHGINYSDYMYGKYLGASQTWCAVETIQAGKIWYTIDVPNVGQTWNDRIGSIKMFNWPLNTVIKFYSDANYGGEHLTTTFNDGVTYEYIPNVYAYNTPWDEVSSFKGSSPH